MRGFPIPLPSRAERHEIVRRVGALFKLTDAIDAYVTTGHVPHRETDLAILAKALLRRTPRRGRTCPPGRPRLRTRLRPPRPQPRRAHDQRSHAQARHPHPPGRRRRYPHSESSPKNQRSNRSLQGSRARLRRDHRSACAACSATLADVPVSVIGSVPASTGASTALATCAVTPTSSSAAVALVPPRAKPPPSSKLPGPPDAPAQHPGASLPQACRFSISKTISPP